MKPKRNSYDFGEQIFAENEDIDILSPANSMENSKKSSQSADLNAPAPSRITAVLHYRPIMAQLLLQLFHQCLLVGKTTISNAMSSKNSAITYRLTTAKTFESFLS